MASRRSRIVPWAVLAVGVAALAISVAAAVARHNRDADAADANIDAQRLRVDAALEEAERVPPRVEVTYLMFPLAELEQVTSGDGEGRAYEVVPTEVAERLRSGVAPPGLRLDPEHARFGGVRPRVPGGSHPRERYVGGRPARGADDTGQHAAAA